MKRKLLITLLALLCVIACAFAFSACGETDSKGNGNNAGQNEINGTYYLYFKNQTSDTVYFTLNDGSYDLFADGTKQDSGTYRINGQNLVFTSTVNSFSGTVTNGKLTIFSQDENITFYKQGKAPDASPTPDKPEDPEKKYYITLIFGNGQPDKTEEFTPGEYLMNLPVPTFKGYTFKGWYDSSDNLYNETTVMPEKNLELTAKWLKGIKEYDVTFNLNYDNAENEIHSTVNGYITYTPTRKGYIFNGWWLSDGMTDEGYILSTKYDTTLIVTQDNLVLYAEWVEISDSSSQPQLATPSVTVSNSGRFEWQDIDGASGYQIVVTKSGSATEEFKKNVTYPSWSFSASEAGYYTVKIRALGDGINTVNSPYVTKNYAYRILSSVTDISFDMSVSVLSWSKVKYATSYELYVDGELAKTQTETEFDMSDYEAGDYSVKINACAYNYNSSESTVTVQKRKLKKPEVTITRTASGLGYKFEWEAVQNADTYILTLNGNEVRVQDCSYKLMNYNYVDYQYIWGDSNTVTFKVCAFDSNADYLISNGEEHTVGKLFNITLSKNGNGYTNKGKVKFGDTYTTSNSQELVAEYGEEVMLTAEINLGYDWLGWTDENDSIFSSDLTYKFSPTNSCSVKANWKINKDMDNFVFESTLTECTIIKPWSGSELTDVYIPDCVTLIKNSAFMENRTIVSLTIGNGATVIDDYAFFGCTSLAKVTIGDNAPSIGGHAFYNCSNLMSITVGKSVKSIGKSAFQNCSKLVEIYNISSLKITKKNASTYGEISANALNIYTGASTESKLKTTDDGLIFYENGDTVTLMGYNVLSSVINLPENFNGKNYSVHERAFYMNIHITSVTVSGGVTSIVDLAFSGCKNLENLTVNENNSAYSSQDGIIYNKDKTEIRIIPEALKGNVVLSDGVTFIAGYSFYNRSGLTSITIPSSVTTIGNNTFENCANLTKIKFLGSMAQWNKISKNSSWNSNTGEYTVHCSDGDIAKADS